MPLYVLLAIPSLSNAIGYPQLMVQPLGGVGASFYCTARKADGTPEIPNCGITKCESGCDQVPLPCSRQAGHPFCAANTCCMPGQCITGWTVKNTTYDLDKSIVNNPDPGGLVLDASTLDNTASRVSTPMSKSFSSTVTTTYKWEMSEQTTLSLGLESTQESSVTVDSPKIPIIGGDGSATASVSLREHVNAEHSTTYTTGEEKSEAHTLSTTWGPTNVPGCSMFHISYDGSQASAIVTYHGLAVPVANNVVRDDLCTVPIDGQYKGGSVVNDVLKTVEEPHPKLSGTCSNSSKLVEFY